MVAFQFSNINSALGRNIGASYVNSRVIILRMHINSEPQMRSEI